MAIERNWDDAIHYKPDFFNSFWSERLNCRRDLLLILGLGWDPRMNALPKALKTFDTKGLRHIHLIKYRPSPSFESPHQKFIEKNTQELDLLTENWAKKTDVSIFTRKEGNLYVGDEEISKYYTKFDISPYTEILIDISSLTKSLYFTLLLILVKKCTKIGEKINLHVVACQDVDLDSQITESVDDTRVLKGFKAKLERLSQEQIPKIWAPLISQGSKNSLRKLYERIGPKDIYPILPFPSRNPRNDDDLLVEHRDILVDEWAFDPLNIIYAAEDDPLDVYRSLLGLYQQQQEALEPLGGVSMVISALSSKLSSIGAFMAAFEKNMAIVHAIGRHDPPTNMGLDFWDKDHIIRFKNNLNSIWLTGEPYV